MVTTAQIAIAIDARRAQEGASQTSVALDKVSVSARSASSSINKLDSDLIGVGSESENAAREFGLLGDVALETAEKTGKGFEHIINRFQTHFGADFALQLVGAGAAYSLLAKAADGLSEVAHTVLERMVGITEEVKNQRKAIKDYLEEADKIDAKSKADRGDISLPGGEHAVLFSNIRDSAEAMRLLADYTQRMSDQSLGGMISRMNSQGVPYFDTRTNEEKFKIREQLADELQQKLTDLSTEENKHAEESAKFDSEKKEQKDSQQKALEDLAKLQAAWTLEIEGTSVASKKLADEQDKIDPAFTHAGPPASLAGGKYSNKDSGVWYPSSDIGNPLAAMGPFMAQTAIQGHDVADLDKIIAKLKEEDKAIGETSTARRADQILAQNDIHLIGAQSDEIDKLKAKVEEWQAKIEEDARKHAFAHLIADDMTNSIVAIQTGTATIKDLMLNMLLDIEKMILQHELTMPFEKWLYSGLFGGGFGSGSSGLGSGGSTYGQDGSTGGAIPPPVSDLTGSGGNNSNAQSGGNTFNFYGVTDHDSFKRNRRQIMDTFRRSN